MRKLPRVFHRRHRHPVHYGIYPQFTKYMIVDGYSDERIQNLVDKIKAKQELRAESRSYDDDENEGVSQSLVAEEDEDEDSDEDEDVLSMRSGKRRKAIESDDEDETDYTTNHYDENKDSDEES